MAEQRYLGEFFADFLNAMQDISHKQKQEMAEAFDLSLGAYSRWTTGKRIPARRRDPRFQELFGLTQDELNGLRTRSKHALSEAGVAISKVAMETFVPHSLEYYRHQTLGAFAVRLAQGPPLTDAEARIYETMLLETLDQEPSSDS